MITAGLRAKDVAKPDPRALHEATGAWREQDVATRGGEERLRALLASETAALAVLDAEGRITLANRGFAALPRRGRGALVGLRPEALFVAADADAAARAVTEALAGRAAPVFEARLLDNAADPDAAVEVFCRPLRGEPGALLRLTDVTERRQLQSQLAAASRLQAVGQIAGGVAHDFNNLLATITGAAEAALSGAPSAAGGELRQILDSAARGAGLVRQLLAFASAQPSQPKIMRLDEAIAAAEPLLRRLLGPGLRLKLALDISCPAVSLDPALLDQILLNLVTNARDAMAEGGTLSIAVREAVLTRRVAGAAGPVPVGRWVVLDVADQGRGIPTDMQGRVFDPFFTTRRGRGGTGLGLSTVLGVVRQSGGHLSLRSREGVGTRFRLWFPPVDKAPVVESPTETRRSVQADACRILLVEDEAPLRRLTRRALETEGHAVTEAEDFASALAAASAVPPDILVSDLVLAAEDGLALAAALRARLPDLPVLLISGYSEGVIGRDLRAEGLTFLAKPFRMAELVEAVRHALGTPSAG